MVQSSKRPLHHVCEMLQQQLVSVTRDRQCDVAERFLEWFGWTEPAPLGMPANLSPVPTVSYLLTPRGQGMLAAHFVLPGTLKPPSAIVQRGLDFCEATRPVVAATRAIKVRYAFMSDLQRAYLYDAFSEELLLTADSPEELEREFRDVLAKERVLEGSLDEVRRHPRSHLARQFREWRTAWSNLLTQQWQVPEEEAFVAMDRLVVLYCLAEKNVLLRTSRQLSQQLAGLVAHAQNKKEPTGLGKAFSAILQELWREWGAEICARQPHADAVLEQDSVVAPLLREFGLISRSKFHLATILESFNYGDAAEKARVRMIPEENEERLGALAAQTIDTIDEFQIELDLAEEGYRAILYWFDQLTSVYERLCREYELRYHDVQVERQGLDLFQWSAADASRPAALRDSFQHAMEHGLVVYCATPHQMRVARLLLYLHLIERCAASRTRLIRFPHVEACLRKRPLMLETDRRMIFKPVESSGEWEAI
ncbi:MAG TPA: hypothetical protein PKY35_09085 [Candidatus Hydrogenedentes bacterium]|nr:hypothetical protein [Candidatus Hydrogenedentota bacterium]HOL77171.1 hypothetical protein [Candidatus Hydrogenedentota bacterium]HPO85890.1 hypothetical protein [Candidatus Hydrogenedentota bacterium]